MKTKISVKEFKENINLKEASNESKLADALKHSISFGNLSGVKKHIDLGADPSAENNSAVKMAINRGWSEIAVFLLSDKRVDPSARNNLAISISADMGQIEIVKLLLNDSRVRNALSQEEINKYKSMINVV